MKDLAITTYSVKDLKQKLKNEQETLQKIKFAHHISAIETPTKIRITRRLIARLKTELRAKELKK